MVLRAVAEVRSAMTDAELVQYARDFRDGMLEGRSSDLMCAMVCWPLAGLLEFDGIRCEAVETWYYPDPVSDPFEAYQHFWIKLEDGRVLDPTIDQFNALFGESWPDVYLGAPTKYHTTVLAEA
jgi:hypothetical protein